MYFCIGFTSSRQKRRRCAHLPKCLPASSKKNAVGVHISYVFTQICCKHACLQTQPACLHPVIYAHLSQARGPANSANVPAPFTRIRCRHACLQTQPACPLVAICGHRLQAHLPANSTRVPAPKHLQTCAASARARLQIQPMCLRHLIYAHRLPACPCKLEPCACTRLFTNIRCRCNA